jgi:hypothetical protein
MSRLESLRRQIEQYKKLAQALLPGAVQNDLEKLAHERQNEINAIKSDHCQSKDQSDNQL